MQVAMATATLTANALPSMMNKVEEKPEDITMKALCTLSIPAKGNQRTA